MQRNENKEKKRCHLSIVVSEVDLQEARNGVDNAVREVESRFDFVCRGIIELNDANKTIKVLSESDFRVNQLLDILARQAA